MRPLPGFDGWYLEGRKLRTGEMVEVCHVDGEFGELAVADEWVPAQVVESGQSVELDGPTDAVGGHRAAEPLTIPIERLVELGGEMRRVELPQARPDRDRAGAPALMRGDFNRRGKEVPS